MAIKEQAFPGAQAKADVTEPRKGIEWGQIGRIVAVVVVVFISLAPLYWTVITSVKSGLELNVSPPTLYPHSFSLENFISDLSLDTFTRDLLNSTIIAVLTTILALVIGILCAYALARMKFRGKGFVLAVTLSMQMIPLIAVVGPLFVIFTGILPIYNTYAALII